VGKIKDTDVAAAYGITMTSDKFQEKWDLLIGYKTTLRSWSGQKIKSKMIEIAVSQVNDRGGPIISIPEDMDGGIRRAIKTFQEFVNWWSSLKDPDEADTKAYFEVCYGWWNKNRGWELRWETEWMTSKALNNRWEYCPASMTKAAEESRTQSGTLKGCVAKNISQKKAEIIKGIQRSSAEQSVKICKRRSKEEKVDERGIYKKLKPDEFVVTKVVKEEVVPSSSSVLQPRKEKDVGKSITREAFLKMTDEEKFELLQHPTRHATTGSTKNRDALTSLKKPAASSHKSIAKKNLRQVIPPPTANDVTTPAKSISPISPSSYQLRVEARIARNERFQKDLDSKYQDKYDTIEEVLAHKARKPSRGGNSEWLLRVKYKGWPESNKDWEPLQKKLKEPQSKAIIEKYMDEHPELSNPPKKLSPKKKVP